MNLTEPIDVIIKESVYGWGYDILIDLWLPIMGIGVTGVFAGLVWRQIRIQNSQLEHSIKLNSAILLRDFDKDTKNDERIKNSLRSLKANARDTTFADNNLDHLLECFEGLAIHWEEKLITDVQISEWFSSDLINMGKCIAIRERLDITLNQNPPVYDKLDMLIKKIAKECDVEILCSTTTSI